jgi:F420H(2)-dependent quinone reductase
MVIEGEYEPSAWGWVAKQVDLYESSGGTKGLTLQGAPCVVMTMRGRRTGKVRKAAVMRIEHEGTYAAVASKGGDDRHPGWYLNLLADPDVTIQDGPEIHALRAREVEGEEKATWWAVPPRSGRRTTTISRRPTDPSRWSCSNLGPAEVPLRGPDRCSCQAPGCGSPTLALAVDRDLDPVVVEGDQARDPRAFR